jgi:hypothetical protein
VADALVGNARNRRVILRDQLQGCSTRAATLEGRRAPAAYTFCSHTWRCVARGRGEPRRDRQRDSAARVLWNRPPSWRHCGDTRQK